MRTSYSALNTYETCPLKYKFQEIDKIKTPKSKEAVFGTLIHSALHFMFNKNPLYPTLDEVINYFSLNWDEKKKKADWNEEVEKAYYEDGIGILKNFYIKNQPWNFHVVDLESRFEVALHDDKSGEDHVLAGIIDRIDRPNDETYEIIDYKTAKRMPAQEVLDRDLQMSIYHLGLIRRWPHLEARNIKLSLYFLKHNEKISTVRDASSLENTKNKILLTINDIEKRTNEDDFSATPGPLCDWCGYRKICPMWKHLYKKSVPTEGDIKKIVEEYLEIKKEIEVKNSRVKILQAVIHQYMDANGDSRLFADSGYITRSIKQKNIFDTEKIRPILEELGRWQDVLKIDEAKIEKIVASLYPAWREKIQKEAVLSQKTTKTLTTSRKKIQPDST